MQCEESLSGTIGHQSREYRSGFRDRQVSQSLTRSNGCATQATVITVDEGRPSASGLKATKNASCQKTRGVVRMNFNPGRLIATDQIQRQHGAGAQLPQAGTMIFLATIWQTWTWTSFSTQTGTQTV